MPIRPYVVRVPKHHWGDRGADMRSTLMTWEWRWILPQDCDELVLDFRENQFLEPWALSMFTCFGLSVSRKYGVPLRVELDLDNPANRHFERMGICEVAQSGTSTDRWDDSDRNTGLHVIHSHDDVTRFVGSTVLLGGESMGQTMDALEYSMAEIGRNVVQHAASAVGGVAMAQHFPDQRRVQLAICDAGQGVFESLRRTYPEIKDALSALKLSLLPHVSGELPQGTYAGEENAGLGLFFCKEIAWRAGGGFWIGSHRALVGVRERDESAQERVYRHRLNPWPGTIVVIDIPSHGIVEDGFEGILSACRTISQEMRTAPGRNSPDFLPESFDLEDIRTIAVVPFKEDVNAAKAVKRDVLLPVVETGGQVVLDFAGVNFATQSFVHALVSDVFKLPGGFAVISFINCTRPTEEAIRLVAAYSSTFQPNRGRPVRRG